MPRRRAGLLLVIAAFVAVLFLFSVLSVFLTDYFPGQARRPGHTIDHVDAGLYIVQSIPG